MAPDWVVTVADQRRHGTTFRQPAEACVEERWRDHRGRPPEVLQTSLLRTVARDGLVTVETNRDSVPPTYVGQRVAVQWGPEGMVPVYHRGTCQSPGYRAQTSSAIMHKAESPTNAGRRPHRPGADLLDRPVPGGGGAGVKRL
jgi:hypothetical protein